MAASRSIEFYFVVDSARRPFAKPLLFHHVPGGPGLSFRNALAHFMAKAGSAVIEIPKAKATLKAAEAWPSRFLDLYRELSEAGLIAVLSQHTNELEPVASDPILTILSEPDAFFAETVAASAASIGKELSADEPGDRWLTRIANPQARAIVQRKIPVFAPDDAAERQRFEALAAEAARRYRAFNADSYDTFADYCRETYGIDEAGHRDEPKRPPEIAGRVLSDVGTALRGRDPVWFDRLLVAAARGAD